jgi:lipopolysaccharide export system permease protein
MARPSATLNKYIGRQFLSWFFFMILSLVAIILLFDTLELIRRTSGRENATIGIVISMALFKTPHMIEKAIPFAILFGAMILFWRLNRNNEIIVVRSTGISGWQFLAPVVVLAMLIGAFTVAVFNPLSSAMLLRYEQLEAKFIRGKSSLAAVSGEGIWLRQATESGHYIIHANKISPTEMRLENVVIFLMENQDSFVGRIDAPVALLKNGYWLLENVQITGPDQPPRKLARYRIDTDLTQENIHDSFAPPETLSFWDLPHFISVLEAAGFSGLRHQLYWHSQLALPLLLFGMVLLAATFSLRHTRGGGTGILIIGGIAAGFLLYFVSDVVSALGISARIPVVLAAWSPAVVSCLLGAAMTFHLEDG